MPKARPVFAKCENVSSRPCRVSAGDHTTRSSPIIVYTISFFNRLWARKLEGWQEALFCSLGIHSNGMLSSVLDCRIPVIQRSVCQSRSNDIFWYPRCRQSIYAQKTSPVIAVLQPV